METKKLTNGFKSPKIISDTEKKCTKCGFETFSLHVLYSHQYKCTGSLLGSMTCCYCRRKFCRLALFRRHKRTCLKSIRKRKTLENRLTKSRMKAHSLVFKDSRKSSAKAFKATCSNCKKPFTSKSKFEAHREKRNCSSKTVPEKKNFSARKSFPMAAEPRKQSVMQPDSQPANTSMNLLSEYNDPGVSCKWCKNIYPNEKILAKHLERNESCALAHYKSKTPRKEEVHTARKSIQHRSARKSLPNSRYETHRNASPRFHTMSDRTSGSARKSLPNSSRGRFGASPLKSLNQCPVCYQKIPDPFKFYQHQKKLNHWGKATKSMNHLCKCPFCSKQFVRVSTLNAHVRSHTDVTEKEVSVFLKKTTCNICAQIFASETAKHQHVRIFHSKSSFQDPSKQLDSSDFYEKEHSLVPLVLKQKLRMHPNTCPICSKEFPSTYFRNKHFQEKHLDAELECKFCPKKFSNQDNLENHMHDDHYERFEFECLVCNTYLATAPHVVLHCTKVHSNQDPKHFIRSRVDKSTVNTPGFEYSQPEFLIDDEGDDGFYCDICKLSFLKKAGLQAHRLSKSHKDAVIRNLETMRRSLSDLPSPKKQPKQSKKTPEILTCNECYEDFTSVKDFVPHRLSHFGRDKYLKINELNRYTCEICGEVSNSHSKVQMHLFWHLQVESTSSNSTVKDKRSDLIVPDRLSGQQVAKKSFGKPPDSQQEIVIGGVKKSLFTCEKCNIGFTTEAHYSLHVRKLCKMKAAPEPNEIVLEDDDSSEDRQSDPFVKVERKNIRYCVTCNTMYDSSLKEVHDRFCRKCVQDSAHVKKNVAERIRSEMVRRQQVATCLACNQLFGEPKEFSHHMLDRHMSLDSSDEEDDLKKTTLCTACNCLFLSTTTQELHEKFCREASYHNFDENSSQEILKPFPQLGGAKAICISCSVVFCDTLTMKKHVSKHKTDPKKDEPHKGLVNNTAGNDPADQDAAVDVSNSSFGAEESSMALEEESEEIASLRDNFSQLFCLLINDPDLMQQLGFNEQPVDNVLVSVLQQMGQDTIEKDDQITDIDCLRKNIRIFLDFCLKDQIMELIESGKTSIDDIVIEALRTFTYEESATNEVE